MGSKIWINLLRNDQLTSDKEKHFHAERKLIRGT